MKLSKGAKSAKMWFIWSSVIMIAVFLVLTAQSYVYVVRNSPPVTDKVVAGKLVFQNSNCMDCHTILGDGAYYASDLTKVIPIRGKGFVRALLANPPKITRQLWPGKYKRVMPDMHLTNKQISSLMAFLVWTSKLDTNGWPPGVKNVSLKTQSKSLQAEPASAVSLIKKLNCGSCHTIKASGLNTAGVLGPDLSNESERNRGINWLVKQIGNPVSIPDSEVAKGYEGKQSLMPAFKNQLTDNQLKTIATFLSSLKEEE